MLFVDRTDAGRKLARRLQHLRGTDAVVLALPRGGVPVGYEVARALAVPLDVIVVRKLGVPFQPELAMGAVGEDGARVLNPEVVRAAGVTGPELAAVEHAERAELHRRLARFRGDRPRVRLAGRTAIVVDDGIATGATARAACQVARAQGAARVVLAVPVAPPAAASLLAEVADEVICAEAPEWFTSIGQWYDDFTQTTDEQVVALLAQVPREPVRASPPAADSADDPPAAPLRAAEVVVPAGTVQLAGRLTVPDHPAGLVVFAHGSGSSRHSPRNRYVAELLQQAGFGTLLFDLLLPREEADRRNVFDIPLLGERLLLAVDWLRTRPEAGRAPIGLFGASTGAAAALWAAAEPDSAVAAVVSRGGRPDLAGDRLALVRAPTLLLVGGNDRAVLELNRAARMRLRCPSRLAVIPGAGHLFEEPGTLRAAAGLAREWFQQRLPAPVTAASTTG
jgi:putative phosphoribosyl transferase